MKSLFVICLLTLVVACAKNTTDPYLMGQRCKPGTTVDYITFMAMSCGNGCVMNIPIVNSTCVYESYTYDNPDYVEPKQ